MDRMRVGGMGLWGLWAGFVLYAIAAAPPSQPDTFTLISHLSSGQWADINPLIVALFNLMGIWPLLYAAVVLVDGRSQSFPAWPFVALSFGLGAFALIPYLALRQPPADPNTLDQGQLGPGLQILESRWLASLLLVGSVGLLAFGLINGSWADFTAEWHHRRFINVMSLDFCALSLLFPVLIRADLARRGVETGWRSQLMTLIPMVGPALYLCSRPPLSSTNHSAKS